MNIQQLRQSLKMKWLSYYAQNRSWLVKMRIWGTYDGLRRPSSGFMLATLSVLEPQFEEILSFLTELSNNPDKIVAALGLNFNPDEELDLITQEDASADNEFFNESLEDIQDKYKPVSLITDYPEVTSSSPTRILNSEQPFADLIPTKLTVSSGTESNGVVRDRQPVTSVAMASAKTLLLEKPATQNLVQNYQRRSLPITTEIPQNDLKSPAVAIKVPSNRKSLKIQLPAISTKSKLSLSSNASSLASWVDEFCQGADWNPGEAIFIHF
jgi:Family of unknown function (DUF5331)